MEEEDEFPFPWSWMMNGSGTVGGFTTAEDEFAEEEFCTEDASVPEDGVARLPSKSDHKSLAWAFQVKSRVTAVILAQGKKRIGQIYKIRLSELGQSSGSFSRIVMG